MKDPEIQPMRKDQTMLLWAAVVVGIGFFVPFVRWAFLPFLYLNTHFHELFHALAAMATGGDVLDIKVFANGSGVTHIIGGISLITGSAGYVGSAILGGIIVLMGRTEKSARRVLGILAVLLGLSMLIFVRGDWAGIASGIFWIAVTGLSAYFARGTTAIFACSFLGLQLVVSSMESMFVLLRLATFTEVKSDAQMLADQTGLPAMLFGLLWFGLSVVVLFFSIRAAWSKPQKDLLCH